MKPTQRSGKILKVAYLCLQITKEGQASHVHVNEIVQGLRRRDIRVDLYEPSYSFSVESPSAIRRAVGFALIQGRLIRRLRHYDILYIRSHFAALPSALAAMILNVPVVQEINGTYDDLFAIWPWTRHIAPLLITASRLQWKWARAIVAVANAMGKWVQGESGNPNWVLIPNAADPSKFRPDATRWESLWDSRYAVFFGALSKWQGLQDLTAATLDRAWPKDVCLVIAGDGRERAFVENEARANNRIVYLGSVPYEHIPGLVAGSIASISPQTAFGLRSVAGMSPVKIYESMACGVPVIATDVHGVADLVRKHECGIVVPINSPSAIADAVAYISDHPDVQRQMGKRGRVAVLNEHSWDRRAASTSDVLNAVTEGRSVMALGLRPKRLAAGGNGSELFHRSVEISE